jgi:DNA polymerase (family 10)
LVSDKKAEIVDVLRELAELTTLDEQSPQAFRVRAYENAKRAVEAYSGDVAALSEAQLTKLDGIGKSTAQKIRAYLDSGRVDKLDALRAKFPPGVVALSQIPGLGPKAVAKLRKELGIDSIEALRAALAEQKLRTLAGFGAKTEEKIARAIQRLGLDGKQRRTAIAAAMPLAKRLVAELEAMREVEQVRYCGSLRRFSETIGDLDIVVASREAAPIMERFATLPLVDEVIVRGETKTSVMTRKGLQIDLRVVAPHQIGAATLYFTGSKAHNIKLRQRAMDRGWLLNEYALEKSGGEVIASETEEAIYDKLGLPWIDEVLREDNGEIELAEAGALPRAIALDAVNGDLHVHTSLSGDGRSELDAMVEAARARGYRFVAITEHAEDLPMQGVKRDALVEQRERMAALQRELGDAITLLHGIELNIDAEGGLDYDQEFRNRFDWCLASVHTHFDLPEPQQTRRITRAMADPSVNMIGHLSARTIGKRPGIELDIDAVLTAAEQTGCALEINCGLPRLDVSVDVMRRARDRDVTFVMTSDAHHHSELDRMQWGVRHALRAWLEPERVANTWSRERFVGWVKSQRARAGTPAP